MGSQVSTLTRVGEKHEGLTNIIGTVEDPRGVWPTSSGP